MNSELIAMVFTGKEDLDNTRQILDRSQGGELFRLIDVIIVYRDKLGESTLQLRRKESDRLNNSRDRLAGDFAEALFGNSRAEDHRQLTDAGVDLFFLQEVTQALKPNSSAYLIYVSGESLIDAGRLIEILEGLPGDLYYTTFRPEVEEALLKNGF